MQRPIADLDGDDRVDLGTVCRGRDSATVLLNNGDGTFAAVTHYAVGEHPDSVALGDRDGDRCPDLATANNESDTVSVLLNDGDGTFAAAGDVDWLDLLALLRAYGACEGEGDCNRNADFDGNGCVELSDLATPLP